jgi:general secretion pathway protein C
MGIFDKTNSLMGKFNLPASSLTWVKFSPWVISAFIGYGLSDLAILQIRSHLLPTKAPPARTNQNSFKNQVPLEDYNIIAQRNILNDDGKIPNPLGSEGESGPNNQQAVPSQLPLTLLGTIVHFNPGRSIATVQINSKSETQSFIVDEEIEGLARITKVERKRLTFVNLQNRRLEFIEIPEERAFDFDLKGGTAVSTGPIERTGRFDFTVKKSELEKMTSNLSQILQQARMEPRFRSDNTVDGFCFVSLQAGSPYESFGFKVGDCIKSVDGEPIDSPQKAMETYNKMKNNPSVRLGVERDGRDELFNYSIQ